MSMYAVMVAIISGLEVVADRFFPS